MAARFPGALVEDEEEVKKPRFAGALVAEPKPVEQPAEPKADVNQLANEFPVRMREWVQGGMKGPKPVYPYSVQGRRQRLSTAGVGMEGIPASLAADVSLAPPSMQAGALHRQLTKHFKKPVKMRTGEDGAEFSIDDGKTWNAVNPPGPQLSDVTGMAGDVASGALSMAAPFRAASVGARVPGPPIVKSAAVAGGAVAGSVMGTFLGEMGRYEMARRRGVIPESTNEMELVREAAHAAGWTGITSAGLIPLTKFYRLFRARGTGDIKDLDIKKLEEDLAAARVKTADIEQMSGKPFSITPGQAMRPGSERDTMLSIEERVQREAPQGRLAGIEDQQREAQRALEGRIQAEAPPPTRDNIAVGSDVRGVLRSDVAGAEAAVAARKLEVERAAQAAVAGNMTPIDAGQLTREGWIEGKRTLQEAFHQRYDEMAAKHGRIQVGVRGVRRVALRHKRVLSEDFAPSMAPEDRALIRDVLAKTEGNEPASLASTQRFLSALREEIRLARRGVSPRKEVVAMQELHDSLLRARNEAVQRTGPNSTNPIRLQEVLKLERDYARAKSMIDRSALGSLIKTGEGGVAITPDSGVVASVLRNQSTTREIVTALRDPAYRQHMGGERALKQGIFGLYEQEVVPKGVFSASAHDAFMRRYSPSLREILSPDEMKRITAPGGAVQLKEQAEQKLEELTQYFNGIGIPVKGYWDASAVVNDLWSPTGLERLNAVMRKVRSVDPTLVDELRGAIALKVRGNISDFNSATGEWMPNDKKLATALETEEWVEAVEKTFGAHYVRALKVLHDAQRFAHATPEKRASGGPISAIWKPYQTIQAALARVTIAPPLSRAGRAQTGLSRQQVAWKEEQLDRLLSDPDAMVAMLKMRRLSPNSAAYSAAAADFLNRVGAFDVDPETGEAAQ